jgi:hypothetical protein
MKGLGVRPGVPDVVAIHRGQVYAIELKTRAAGQLTLLRAIQDIRAAGGHAKRSAMASIARGLLRGRVVGLEQIGGRRNADRQLPPSADAHLAVAKATGDPQSQRPVDAWRHG